MWNNCKNLDECKNLFRRLALRLHPDHGGSDDLMILLKESYDEKLMTFEKRKRSPSKAKKEVKPEKTFTNTDWTRGEPFKAVLDDVGMLDPQLIDLIEEIFDYSCANPKFKSDFFDSVLDFLNEKKYVTSGQFNALIKIYYSFRMNEKKQEK